MSFYTNNTLLIAGSLLFRDMKTMSELASGAVAQASLLARGATEEQAGAWLQPIVIDTQPLNNPWMNYSVYLNNTFMPGILMVLIFMVTVYSIGVEIKERTARQWLRTGRNSIWISLCGKLLPHTAVFFLMARATTPTSTASCTSRATAASCPCCWPPSAWYLPRKAWVCS